MNFCVSKVIGKLNFSFLEFKLRKGEKNISRSKYTRELLKTLSLENIKTYLTSMSTFVKLDKKGST